MRSENGKARNARSGHAMSFEDIGREMGITAQGARWIFNQAMRKLRRKPQMRTLFRSLPESKAIPIHEQFEKWASQ